MLRKSCNFFAGSDLGVHFVLILHYIYCHYRVISGTHMWMSSLPREIRYSLMAEDNMRNTCWADYQATQCGDGLRWKGTLTVSQISWMAVITSMHHVIRALVGRERKREDGFWKEKNPKTQTRKTHGPPQSTLWQLECQFWSQNAWVAILALSFKAPSCDFGPVTSPNLTSHSSSVNSDRNKVPGSQGSEDSLS